MNTAQVTPLRIHDAIALPDDDVSLGGRAVRSDAYGIDVTSRNDETLAALHRYAAGGAVGLIMDDTGESLYGTALIADLRAASIAVSAHTLPSGEQSKSLGRATELWDWLATTDLARRDLIVTFGGGVVNDLGGWVASAYMRGVPYVNVPTTLIAQVDGAIGGKVAANHPTAKNLIGAFAQPAGVICDVSWLRSLPRRHVAAGLAECVKKAMIASPAYWDFLRSHAEALLRGDADVLRRLVRAAVAIKTELIARDPYEHDLRRALNFGHTIAHPLETVTGYASLLHGEAVSIGMVVDARVACARGLLSGPLFEELVALLRAFELPVAAADLPGGAPLSLERVMDAVEKVRLIRGGSLRFVLPEALGVTRIADDVTAEEIAFVLRELGFDRR